MSDKQSVGVLLLVLGVSYVAFLVGSAAMSVGDDPSCEPFSAGLPIAVAVMFLPPLVVGLLAGLLLRGDT